MKLKVYKGGIEAGILEKREEKFIFTYDALYLAGHNAAVSFSLPLQKESFECDSLFAAFFGLLPEGNNKAYLCRYAKIDESDAMALLVYLVEKGNAFIGDLTFEVMA
ncbi:MAG: HipA N-terminal domain-containing protein [Verrucomicrobiota bacterium]